MPDKKVKTKGVEISVVGMQYRVTPSTLKYIGSLLEGGPVECRIEREPDNVHDENAIKVILNESPYKGLHIGFFPRGVAALYAPLIDQGRLTLKTAKLTELVPVGAHQEGTLFFRYSLQPTRSKRRRKTP
jgi:hypothetical protein